MTSAHFSAQELACRCGCGADKVADRLLFLLEWARDHFDAPVLVRSGVRCEAHNRAVGGAENSQHLFGRAADIVVVGHSPADVASFFEGCGVSKFLGVGRYPDFTHIDVRGVPARWGG